MEYENKCRRVYTSNAVKTKDLVLYKYHNSILPSSSILYCSSFSLWFTFFFLFLFLRLVKCKRVGPTGGPLRVVAHSSIQRAELLLCTRAPLLRSHSFPLPHFFAYLVFSERGAGQLTSVEGFFHETPLTTSTLLFLSSFSSNFLPFLCASSYVCALARTKRR